MVFRESDRNCDFISRVYVFHAKVGVQASINSKDVSIDNIIVAECKTAVKIRPGILGHFDNVMKQTNWYVTAIARPNCQECYTGSLCSQQVGFQLAAIATKAYPPPSHYRTSQADTITTDQQLEGRLFMENVSLIPLICRSPSITSNWRTTQCLAATTWCSRHRHTTLTR